MPYPDMLLDIHIINYKNVLIHHQKWLIFSGILPSDREEQRGREMASAAGSFHSWCLIFFLSFSMVCNAARNIVHVAEGARRPTGVRTEDYSDPRPTPGPPHGVAAAATATEDYGEPQPNPRHDPRNPPSVEQQGTVNYKGPHPRPNPPHGP